ncbi:NAD(P)-dependent oxidoreductase [Deinococcus rubellus]|uniref:NAD(P)-dependent oxidoreductase n=1 Tax=Deinococcus rubellus TaxID=1889240 RepID=A0ABY5YG90_9DEIO|nr:NAD(P)-dependent oxidoreductase [Deinococcus rubellus]UWX63736.1 NAD(P)-dependent oxidoreductase [Deinococcus rubellus]
MTDSSPTSVSRPQRVLLTGAAGHIGTALRQHLRGHYGLLRLSDLPAALAGLPPAGPGEELCPADLTDPAAVREVTQGMDAVIHLGGIPDEDTYPVIRAANMDGTANLLAAAQLCGVRRVAFASSIHAVGYAPHEPTGMNGPVRPDTFYGVSKVFGEALGRMYVDRYGLEFVSVRICSFLERPREARNLATWLSPRDAAQLFRRAVDAPGVTYLTVAGISGNTRRWMNPDGWDALGYAPEDNAEEYAAEIGHIVPAPGSHAARFQGGVFTEPDYLGRAGARS